MRNICNFMIIQRDADGMGRARFAGEFNPEKGGFVVARVMREDDNMTVVPWQVCETDGNSWSIDLVIPQGGLYRAEARQIDKHADSLDSRYDWAPFIECVYHIGVGDVFIVAGQSNMSGYAKDPAYDPPQLGVHLFDNSGNWVLAAHPLNCVPNPIYRNNDANSGVSPALSFARTIKRNINVPVGLVAAAQGGSSLEWWNPADEDPYLYEALCEKMNEVGNFKGMIWAQGCNETGEEDETVTYYEKFKQAVSLWREKFGHFPIVTCQLNRHAYCEEDRDRNWGIVREAQRQAARTIKDVYIVPTMDMFTVDGIHNSSPSCVAVGERIANVMLKCVYSQVGYAAPSIKRITKLDAKRIQLEFDENKNLRTMDDNPCGMNIEDENGLMECEKVQITNDGAIVTGEREIVGKAVFHAYWKRQEPAFFVRDIYGMPMLACYGVEIESEN